ncbi:MAG: 5-(carboxyamino)imidazole ribonucleotide synthase [Bacteroidota bacterium]|nr:5-(carboxyamino)imidazole ribonucleotide synthase [Bacteroidota bacterium]MDP4211543.1 5-(carboxyamino)imidazole ribonucleotide synthase [Bacteroidota bacterium]MDP4249758.1 5-(carboxyamino)imidazole ribonucleotide synthase [Bacteroidota bacterium]
MLKIGILGGGQLGRMLLQAAANYPVITHVMESDPECPAAHLCHQFTRGDIRNFEDVYQFGKGLDGISIEIESVNVEALEKLESEGIRVYPSPSALRIIRDKILQKQFYKEHDIPTSPFYVTQNRDELRKHDGFLPAVHKMGSGGYDGRGVQILSHAGELHKGFDAPSILERKVNIHKEISQIIAMNRKGETAIFPAAEMIFDPVHNQLDYQLSPAEIPQQSLWRIEAIALKVVKDLKTPGIFAVELFIDKNGDILVNETAPRVHNSGHHTIEANYCSQFDMLWRVMLDYPLGNPKQILPSAMVNLVGSEGQSGEACYEGLEDVLKLENAFLHLYGKKETRPGRKMGHVTILSTDKSDLVYKARTIKQKLRITSKQPV